MKNSERQLFSFKTNHEDIGWLSDQTPRKFQKSFANVTSTHVLRELRNLHRSVKFYDSIEMTNTQGSWQTNWISKFFCKCEPRLIWTLEASNFSTKSQFLWFKRNYEDLTRNGMQWASQAWRIAHQSQDEVKSNEEWLNACAWEEVDARERNVRDEKK